MFDYECIITSEPADPELEDSSSSSCIHLLPDIKIDENSHPQLPGGRVIYQDDYGTWTEEDQLQIAGAQFDIMDYDEDAGGATRRDLVG